MKRKFPVMAIAALAVFAAPAFGAEPLNKPSPADNTANDLNAKALEQVQQQQDQMQEEVNKKNEEAMRKWREENEQRYREWQQQQQQQQNTQ